MSRSTPDARILYLVNPGTTELRVSSLQGATLKADHKGKITGGQMRVVIKQDIRGDYYAIIFGELVMWKSKPTTDKRVTIQAIHNLMLDFNIATVQITDSTKEALALEDK